MMYDLKKNTNKPLRAIFGTH